MPRPKAKTYFNIGNFNVLERRKIEAPNGNELFQLVISETGNLLSTLNLQSNCQAAMTVTEGEIFVRPLQNGFGNNPSDLIFDVEKINPSNQLVYFPSKCNECMYPCEQSLVGDFNLVAKPVENPDYLPFADNGSNSVYGFHTLPINQ